jgi:hypothetical protein
MSKAFPVAIISLFLLGVARPAHAAVTITFAFIANGGGIAQFMSGSLQLDPTTSPQNTSQALEFNFPASVSGQIQMGEIDIFNPASAETAVLRFTDANGDLHSPTTGPAGATEMFVYLLAGTGTEASTGFPTTKIDSSATVNTFQETVANKPSIGSFTPSFWYIVPSTTSPGYDSADTSGRTYQYVAVATPEASSCIVWMMLMSSAGGVAVSRRRRKMPS